MTPPVPHEAAVDAHARLTRELAQALRERADLRAASLSAYTDTYQRSVAGVTERREAAKAAASHFETEVIKLDGEIDALRAELTDVEFAAKYASSDG